MKMYRVTGPLMAAALVLGACEATEDPRLDGVEDESAGAEPARVDTAEGMALTPGVLAPIDRSGVRGRAEITRGDGDVVVTIEAEGLEPGTRYAAHVHEGRCADGGPVSLPLGRIEAGEDGRGSTRMRVDAERLPDGTVLFVQIHTPDDRPVACADLAGEDRGS